MKIFNRIGFLALLAGSGLIQPTFAEPAANHPSRVQGHIERVTFGAEGRPDGVVLDDRTFVKFRPESVPDAGALHTGDLVVVNGFQVLTLPNKVFDQVTVRRGNTLIVDDTRPHPSSSGRPLASKSGLKPLSASAPLYAVGATPDGKVDRLILADNTSVQLSPEGYIDVHGLQLGERIGVTGAGNSIPGGGRSINALDALGASKQPLILARGQGGEKWRMHDGVIRRMLVTPTGQIDGLLLTDDTVIRIPAIQASQGGSLKSGEQVRVAGPESGGQVRTDLLVLRQSNAVIDLNQSDRSPDPRGMAGTLAALREPLTLMKVSSQILKVLINARGELETVLLTDGTTVRVPQSTRLGLKFEPKRGDPVTVTGSGGKYPQGAAIEADLIQLVSP